MDVASNVNIQICKIDHTTDYREDDVVHRCKQRTETHICTDSKLDNVYCLWEDIYASIECVLENRGSYRRSVITIINI